MTLATTVNSNWDPKDFKRYFINAGADDILMLPELGDMTSLSDSNFECQARERAGSLEALFDVPVEVTDHSRGILSLLFSQSMGDIMRHYTQLYLVIDFVNNQGDRKALYKGVIKINPAGAGDEVFPTEIVFQTMLSQLEAQVALASNVVSDFESQHGSLDLAVNSATDANSQSQAALQQVQSSVASLNSAAGFAFESFGAQSSRLTLSTDIVDVAHLRYADMTDGGEALRMLDVPELDLVLRDESLEMYYSSDGSLWKVLSSADSPTGSLNWWRTGKLASAISVCNGHVFIGLLTSNTSGLLSINLLTGELRRLHAGSAQSNKGLFMSDVESMDLPIAWELDGYLADQVINSVNAVVHKGTPINPETGLPDPTIYVSHGAGFEVLEPSPTLDTLKINSLLHTALIRSTAISHDFIASTAGGAISVFKRNVSGASFNAARIYHHSDAISTPLGSRDLILSEDNVLSYWSTTGGLSQIKLEDNVESCLWRHKSSGFDTGWCVANSEVVISESTADLTTIVGGVISNKGSGSDLTVVGSVERESLALSAERACITDFSENNYLTYTLTTAIGTGDFCISMTCSDNSGGGIFGLGDLVSDSSPAGGIAVHRTSLGALYVYFETSPVIVSDVFLDADRFYRVDLIRKDGDFKVVVDGRIVHESVVTLNLTATDLTVGGGFSAAKVRYLSQFMLSTTAPSVDQLQFMYRSDRHSYNDNSKILLPSGDAVNSISTVRGFTYVAQDGGANSATISKFDKNGILVEEIIPQAIESLWSDSDVDNLNVTDDGDLLASSSADGAIRIRPALDLRGLLALKNHEIEYRESDEGVHTIFTSSATPAVIWRKNVSEGAVGDKYLFEVHAADSDGNEAARYSGVYHVKRNFGGSAIQVSEVWTVLDAGSTGTPSIGISSNVLELDVTGVASTDLYWSVIIIKEV